MATLVYAEGRSPNVSGSTLNCVTAALEFKQDVHILVSGPSAAQQAEQLKQVQGVSKILLANDVSLEHGLAERVAELVVAVGKDYEAILVASSSFGKNFLPRVAAQFDVGLISDVIAIESPKVFQRPIYAGSAIATVESLDAKQLCTIRTTSFEPAASTGGSAEVETITTSFESEQSQFVSEELAQSDRPELADARVVISGGRGMQSGENFKLLEGLADKLGAAIGASRAAVDAGYVPNEYQVGQTGKIVAPELYIAVGISGAIQHLAGMKNSKVIVAINKDEEAPIFQVADYGLVADLFTALPELEQAL